MKAPFLKRFLV